MTYAPDDPSPQDAFPKRSLGIGSILSQSVSILFSRFPLLFGVALAVQAALAVLSLFIAPLVTALPASPSGDPTALGNAFGAQAVVVGLVTGFLSLLATTLTTGILVLAAYDARLGNPSRLGAYVGAAFAALLPLVVLTFVYSVALGVGFVLLVVPGLLVLTVWSVYVPAVVAEGARYGGLSRSRELTRGYRWPILGLQIVLILLGILVSLITVGLVTGQFTASVGEFGVAQAEAATSTVGRIVNVLVAALTSAFFAVVTAVLFARLKELKEGVGIEGIADVF